jgi:predicted DNA-binding transcriptional regulator YafY
MRAGRLISLIMLLQARGRITAQALAVELEVSERTIYRDIIALSSAGIPVYGEPGLDGGYSLVENYRTSLTGLTEGEARALFMLRIPEPLAALGLDQDLKSALRKLSAVLPNSRRDDEKRVHERFHLDSSWWRQVESPAPYLDILYQAVWQDRCIRLVSRPMVNVEIEQFVDPYGLVAKAGVWYLVCRSNGQIRVHLISELSDVQCTSKQFERPSDFNLVATWSAWCAEREQSYFSYPVKMRISPGFIPCLPRLIGDSVREKIQHAGLPDAEGWIQFELAFESLEDARGSLLGFGGGVEVVAPLALRLSLWDYARQVTARYQDSASNSG